MALQVRIGASSAVYDSVDLANQMRGRQKLSITGSGDEIKTELARLQAVSGTNLASVAANIGSIKATSDITLTVSDVATYKAALLKLGTRSVVVNNNQLASTIEDPNGDNYVALDAVYTKLKAFTLASTPKIQVEKLATAVNLQGLENLSGKLFNVEGTATTIKDNMSALLRNVSKIGEIHVKTGETAVFTAAQLNVLGSKLVKDGTAKIVVSDTADNLLTTSNLALINKFNNTNINDGGVGTSPVRATLIDQVLISKASIAQLNQLNTLRTSSESGSYTAGATVRPLANIIGNIDVADSIDNLTAGTVIATVDGSAAGSITAASDLINATSHGFSTGDLVTYSTAGAAIAGLTNGSSYFVNAASAGTFKLYDTKANAVAGGATGIVDITVVGTGTADTFTKSNLSNAIANVYTWNGGNGVTFAKADVTAASDLIAKTGHGFATGDKVTFTSSSATPTGGLVNGTSYYVKRIDANSFKLYDTSANANTGGAGGLIDLDGAGAGISDTLKLSSTNTRVTINGAGLITAAQLSSVAVKAKANNSGVAVTYSAKAVDIQSNLQAIQDNRTDSSSTKRITEIVVSDGSVNGKKALNLTMSQYTAMNTQIANGLLGNISNYALTVTGASFGDLTTLQNDNKVAQFSISNADASIIGTLAATLGKSKLKTISTSTSVSAADKATLRTELTTIGSNVDRAKLKILS
jgi:hypothetical protein